MPKNMVWKGDYIPWSAVQIANNLCCLGGFSDFPSHPPSLQGCQAREVGETANDRESREQKKDKKTVGILTLNSRNPCYPPFRTEILLCCAVQVCLPMHLLRVGQFQGI